MHAVVATVHVESPENARSMLESSRVPLVQRAPGMVCGYWLEPIDGKGMSIIVFETKEEAEAAAAYPLPPMAGVTPLALEIREVYAHV